MTDILIVLRWDVLYDFVVKFGGVTLKKLKLGRDLHVDGPVRKILKHQIKVDSNP